MDAILKYFPNLSQLQKDQFQRLLQLYPEWNDKINVISRKDISNLEVHHILHSLSIGKFINFTPGTRVLDFGSGGGLPGLPLAVLFPECHFHLVDRVGKKLKVADAIAQDAEIKNISIQHGDINECREKYDFVVSRAVMPLKDLVKLSRKNISKAQKNGYPNGLITLKGGELNDEISRYGGETLVENLSQWFPDEEFFKTKKLTYSPIN